MASEGSTSDLSSPPHGDGDDVRSLDPSPQAEIFSTSRQEPPLDAALPSARAIRLAARSSRAKEKQREIPGHALSHPASGTPARTPRSKRMKTTLSSSPQTSPASSSFHTLAPAYGGETVVPAFASSSAQDPAISIIPEYQPFSQATLHAPLDVSPGAVPRYLFPRARFTRDAPLLPAIPKLIRLLHPAINLPFLQFPAYDLLPGRQLQFGIHHETIRTACMIVAYNRPGYLSHSRDSDEPVDVPLGSVLPAGSYYYRLDGSRAGELYPICRDFKWWNFPHGKMPPSWPAGLPTESLHWPSTSTAVSLEVKERDKHCLISGSEEYLTTAHIVSREDGPWLELNNMNHYLGDTLPVYRSPRNLFSLRYDLHLGGFDRAQFVIVPKSGNLVVHFLKYSPESAMLYHNVGLDHRECLSLEALYARFAWALMMLVREFDLSPKHFKFTETEGDDDDGGQMLGASGKGKGKSRKRKYPGRGVDGDIESDESNLGNDTSGTYHGRSMVEPKEPNILPLQPDSWLCDVLHKIAPGDQSSLEADTHEIEEDLRIAAHDHPFLVDPTIKPTAHDYHNLLWYPGMDVVKRRKWAYLDSHPHIRAIGGPHLQSNGAISDSD